MTNKSSLECQDLPRMTWSSAAAAFMWAEETASRDNYKSPLAAMQGNIIDGRLSGWTHDDYKDLSYSILTSISNIDDSFAREVFRYVYCHSTERQTRIASLFAVKLQDEHQTKSYWQLKQVSEVAMMRIKLYKRDGKQIGLGFYAKALGIQRPSLYSTGWQMVIKDAENSVDSMLKKGESLAKIALYNLEIIS